MNTHLHPNRHRSPYLVTVVHIQSTTNPNLSLHQEYAMRTNEYDDLAQVKTVRGWVPFAKLVEKIGIEAAIRSVKSCVWMSDREVELYHTKTEVPIKTDCTDCLEVAHA